MDKIRICYVIVNCKIAGPMNQTLNIIKYADREKFVISFVTLFAENEDNSMIEEYKKECCYLGCLNLDRIKSLLVGRQKLRKKLMQYKPDIIHAVGMPAYRLSLGYPQAMHIVTMRNYMYEDYPSHYNKLIGKPLAFFDMTLLKERQKKGDAFIACSESLANIYREKEKITIPYIRNAVELTKFTKKENNEVQVIREKLGIPIDKKVLIYTGNFSERKNQEEAIRGFIGSNKYKNAILVLCGGRGNFSEIKEKYGGEGNIIFTGRIKNVSDYLKASDFYISTSKSEGMPNAVLEAMATGLGVLLSDIPQHKELFGINPHIGLLYMLGNIEELIEKISFILDSNPSEYNNEAYKTVCEFFSAEKMSQQYQEVYSEIYTRKKQ